MQVSYQSAPNRAAVLDWVPGFSNPPSSTIRATWRSNCAKSRSSQRGHATRSIHHGLGVSAARLSARLTLGRAAKATFKLSNAPRIDPDGFGNRLPIWRVYSAGEFSCPPRSGKAKSASGSFPSPFDFTLPLGGILYTFTCSTQRTFLV